jgi:ABC-type phosphate/phosphonate transport system ATPase subunit
MVLGLFPKEDKIKAMDALERVNILDKYFGNKPNTIFQVG